MAGVSGSGLSCGAMSGSDWPRVTGRPAADAASGWRLAGELADGASALLAVGWPDLQFLDCAELGLVRNWLDSDKAEGNMFS